MNVLASLRARLADVIATSEGSISGKVQEALHHVTDEFEEVRSELRGEIKRLHEELDGAFEVIGNLVKHAERDVHGAAPIVDGTTATGDGNANAGAQTQNQDANPASTA